eukprot:COSAG01_NODE_9389_length_2459_cov_72.850847_2_plen_61_part_00
MLSPIIRNYTQEEIKKIVASYLNNRPLAAVEIGIARRIIESRNKKQIDTSQYKSETNRCV